MTARIERRTYGQSIRAAVTVLAIASVGLTACADGGSAQDDYCAAGESLQSSIAALAELDLLAVGTDGLQDAVAQVRDDLAEVRSSASDAAAGDVEELDTSMTTLDGAIADLGGDLTSENATAVGDAIQGVRAAAAGVADTLADC